tara:strand:- start:59 stop:292 length:234 start_codon:yes stop_codon:yes gene_type:complete
MFSRFAKTKFMASTERFKELNNWIYKTLDYNGILQDYSSLYTNKEDAKYWYKYRYLRKIPDSMRRKLILTNIHYGED